FFIAGYDTTSASLSHVVYYLSQNKDKQQILREELNALDTDFTYENLNQCQYLNAVIDETLRLAPPLGTIQRECVKEYKLGNTGTDPEFFPDPDQFKPERFLNPTHHPYAYLPFGCGPRHCVGVRFALNEMRMCIAKIVHNFEFTLAPGFQLTVLLVLLDAVGHVNTGVALVETLLTAGNRVIFLLTDRWRALLDIKHPNSRIL
ncbi:unnamed protein product, partial [Medioppia subpectinata]